MAQLIKIEDYVSRYEYDVYRYSSQFSRLKRDRWLSLKREWEESFLNENISVKKYAEQQKRVVKGGFNLLRKLYNRDNQPTLLENDEESPFKFKYKSLPELKKTFLKELFDFQLKWASSTIAQKSKINKYYYDDETLKWFLQSFPDNYFLLYYPVVTYPKATIQFDIVLIGPTDIWCIVHLNGQESTIFQSFSERYWLAKNAEQEKKVVNPFLSLNRMSAIIKRILAETGLDLMVRKAILTKEGYIDIHAPWSGAEFLDQRSYKEWNEKIKNNTSPIKSVQLKFSQNILNVCQTLAEGRGHFEKQDQYLFEDEE